ncbi:MAG: DUF4445 domain-containing protein [Puniceicoccaceae bacterium]|nr:MAG: DUF4445 domain-containing protein [Puniceicoccaceae bacterium]
MKTLKIRLLLPDKQTAYLKIDPSRSDQRLADAMENAGYGLNTRCGGRGLCRGCRVHYRDANGTTQTLRACQTTLAEIPPAANRLQIPKSSWSDQSLYGVSSFDIHPQLNPYHHPRPGIGLALDIGTTTLAGMLWDLENGHALADHAIANPQRTYGDDVLSRISYATEHASGRRRLRQRLFQYGLAPLLQTLCRQANCSLDAVSEATLAGNPVMLHTVLGESLDGFAKYPFKPEFLEARTVALTDLRPGAPLPAILLPSLAPFVGADIVAGAFAAGMLNEAAPTLLIDFGTNGEILLKHAGGYLTTATAAGPAFEGGRLACGASAGPGVLSAITHEGGQWSYHLCQPCSSGSEPEGISGAAYVDFIALALERGLLNRFGRFDRAHPDVSLLEDADGSCKHIIRLSPHTWISEVDVAELLQAKAAIAAGVAVLLEIAGLQACDLRKVYIAGGFGYHLNTSHAHRIGLLPSVEKKCFETIGNASLGGASACLLQNSYRNLAPLLENCQSIELNLMPEFSDHYTDGLLLEPFTS